MLNIPSKLKEYSLSKDNSLVMCSGILNTLNLRESHDIDLVVDENTFERLKKSGDFEIKHYGNDEMLLNNVFEICKTWEIEEWNKVYRLDDFKKDSVIIDNVRYISLNFLLKYKQLLASRHNPREKDINDIEIIKGYLEYHKI